MGYVLCQLDLLYNKLGSAMETGNMEQVRLCQQQLGSLTRYLEGWLDRNMRRQS